MGRPPHGIGKDALQAVLVSIPFRLIDWADRRAALLGLSRSAVVRDALEDYADRLKEKPKPSKDYRSKERSLFRPSRPGLWPSGASIPNELPGSPRPGDRRAGADSVQPASLTMANWLDDLLGGNEPATKAQTATSAPAVHTVWIQTRPPSNGDCGGTEAGHYFVEGGVLSMCDEDGKPSGITERLTTGANERAVAGRLRRQAWMKEQGSSEQFNRPLDYSRLGNA